jgi:hypothetical protein
LIFCNLVFKFCNFRGETRCWWNTTASYTSCRPPRFISSPWQRIYYLCVMRNCCGMRSHIFATSIIRPSIPTFVRFTILIDSFGKFIAYRSTVFFLIIKYVFTTCVHIASDKQLLVF